MLPQASSNSCDHYDTMTSMKSLTHYTHDRVAKVIHSPTVKSSVSIKKVKVAWKKPKEYPRRPLSAYNLFFQHERQNLITIRDQKAIPFEKKEGIGGFAGLARSIASKWKDLDENSRTLFDDKAKIDRARYKAEVKLWKSKHSLKKLETVVCSPSTPSLQQLLSLSLHQKECLEVPAIVTPERLQMLHSSSQTTRTLLQQLLLSTTNFNIQTCVSSTPLVSRTSMPLQMTLDDVPSLCMSGLPNTSTLDFGYSDLDKLCQHFQNQPCVAPTVEKPSFLPDNAIPTSYWDEVVQHFSNDEEDSVIEPLFTDDYDLFFKESKMYDNGLNFDDSI